VEEAMPPRQSPLSPQRSLFEAPQIPPGVLPTDRREPLRVLLSELLWQVAAQEAGAGPQRSVLTAQERGDD
jgi:hypothetical protein